MLLLFRPRWRYLNFFLTPEWFVTTRAEISPDINRRGIEDVIKCNRSIRAVALELDMKPITLCRYDKQAKQFGATDGLPFGHNRHLAVFDNGQEPRE